MDFITDSELFVWFRKRYSEQSESRLDIDKSCIRFRVCPEADNKIHRYRY